MSKIKSIALTLRPRGGITDDDIALLLNIVLDRCDWLHVITEKTDAEKHIHAALYLKNETTLSAFNQLLRRKMLKSFEERNSIWKYACVSRTMYNDDFLKKYLMEQIKDGEAKDDEMIVLESKLPSEEERATYYSDVKPARKTRAHGDPYYLKLEKLYYEHAKQICEDEDCMCNTLGPSEKPTLEQIERFLCRMMYKERRLNVISDSRKMRRVCKNLRCFIMKATAYCWAKGDVNSDVMQFPEFR